MPLLGFRANKLYMRCPHCGDSSDAEHGHLIVYIDSGFFHCLRCDSEGQLNFADQLGLYTQQGSRSKNQKRSFTALTPTSPEHQPTPGPADWLRRSLVTQRYNLQGIYDVFESRDLLSGDVQGYHVRDSVIKQSLNWGTRAFGYRGNPPPLGTLIRIVEGPYDVVYPHDVCTYGLLPSAQQIRQLRLFRVILCPDGDVWKEEHAKVLHAYLRRFEGSYVRSIERLDGDPDEVSETARETMSWKDPFIQNHFAKKSIAALLSAPSLLGPEWGF